MSTNKSLFLAMDTSGAEAGLVLSGSGRTDASPLEAGPSGAARTEDLAAVAARLLAARGASASDLAMVAAVIGPGSYTGLRSGLAFLRGLAFTDALPAIAIGSLELLARRGGSPGDSVLAVSDAGSGRYVVARYRVGDVDVDEELAPTIVEAASCQDFLRTAGRASIVVVASPESPSAAVFVEAARDCDMAVRGPGRASLETLAQLAESRWHRGLAVRAPELLPAYVGQQAARPNRNRIAVLETPE